MSAKVNVTLLVVCLCFVTISAEETTEKYTTKYDNINLDDLLKNDRLRRNYVACLLNEGPCTPDAQELKSNTTNIYVIALMSVPKIKDFFLRLTSRRSRNGLLEMLTPTKRRLGTSDTLLN